MTNLEKFIAVMNSTFDAKFKPQNMQLECCPCGALKKKGFACYHFRCDGCKRWWQKEYHPVGLSNDELTVLAFALRYAAPRHTYAPSLVCDYIKTKLPLMLPEQRERLRDDVKSEQAFGFMDELAVEAFNGLLREIDKYDTDEGTA